MATTPMNGEPVSTGESNFPAPNEAPPQKAALWEDFFDILYAPASVFQRRRSGKWGAALLVMILASLAVAAIIRPIMEPLYLDHLRMVLARAAESQPGGANGPPDSAVGVMVFFYTYSMPIMLGMLVLGSGFVTWFVLRIFGPSVNLNQSLMIVTYATVPRIIAQVAMGVIAFATNATSLGQVATSPARFLNDPNADLLLNGLLTRFDIFTIWSVVLLVIGVRAVGSMPRSHALATGLLVWAVGTVPVLLSALSGP